MRPKKSQARTAAGMPFKSPETARPDVFSFEVPLRTVNPLNGNKGGHWGARKRRAYEQRQKVALHWLAVAGQRAWGEVIPPGPWLVTLTRIGPGTRPMDDDGCVASLKHVRDEIASRLGVDDGNMRHVRFFYAQERGPWGVRIEVREGEP